ncbi:MAG TPA: T9SS type A sorting domain-containing protein [Saprospiraceae bacterium]|nr:T9SS type A sorting domain-containing protein [Saprospiraceae bacterium]
MRNKILLTLLVMASVIIHLSSQSQDLSLIGTGGGMQKTGDYYISYSIGEPFIQYENNSGHWITEGFQQPEKIDLTTSAKDILPSSLVTIYPNPTSGSLHVDWSGTIAYDRITIENNLGQTVLQKNIRSKDIETLSLDHLQSGIYFLRLHSGTSSTSMISFIKL